MPLNFPPADPREGRGTVNGWLDGGAGWRGRLAWLNRLQGRAGRQGGYWRATRGVNAGGGPL